MTHGSQKAVVAALLGNLAIAVFKLAAALVSGSSSMLAEGYHSVSDTFNQILLLIGLKSSQRAADRGHPFGHGKEQYFWSFVVAMILFGIAGTLSIREGYHKIIHPQPIEQVWLAYLAIGMAAVFETFAFRIAFQSIQSEKRREQHKSFFEAIRRSKDPTILTVFFEDALALAGLFIAAVGITLTVLTRALIIDALASILIGVLLMVFALYLAMETKKLLLGESVTPFKRAKILNAVRSFEKVQRVISLKTMHLGPEEVLVTLEIDYQDGLSLDELEDLNGRIETRIRTVVPKAQIYLEPASGQRAGIK